MATVLSGISDYATFLASWTNANYDWTYGAFWSSSTGLVTSSISSSSQFTQWGNGDTSGGDGVLLESDSYFQYSGGNLTGEVNTLTFGTGFAADNTAGISLTTDYLTLELDQSFDYSGTSLDSFDYAIYGMRYNTLSYLYAYLAETGTVIEDTAGDDILVGFSGVDTFVFSGGDDEIVTSGPTGTSGYVDGTDILDVSGWGVTDFADLDIGDDGLGNAIVESASGSVWLQGVDYTVLDASDFVFASAALAA